MPLPPPDAAREPLHTRSIRVDSYARDDGLWDLEAELIDTKAYDFSRSDGSIQRAGDPVHHMRMRITIDDKYAIVAALVVYDAAPYDHHCTAIAPEYQGLVGMNLLRNFRQAVKERFGRTAGCTHMSELSLVLPTAAVQSMSARRRAEQQRPHAKRPFSLDGCHALKIDGPVVKEYYPRWYTAVRGGARRE